MSEGLKAIQEYNKVVCPNCQYYYGGKCNNEHECFSRIIEKELKALEIIKEKSIILQFIKETYTVEQYNAGVFGTLVKPLAEEEYELLKEVLL